MFFCPEKLYFKLLSAIFITFISFSINLAQTKKSTKPPPASKTTSSKKTQTTVKKTSSVKATTAKKSKAELRREAEAAKKRAALLEEKRRRDQAIRAARAKKAAFERGLRTDTVGRISSDNIEGEDLEVRRAAVTALENRAGTVVVMEAQTGKILSIVNQDWAIRKSFKPCSTIKLVTAIAGLNEKEIDDEGNIASTSFRLNLDDALAYSNNAYFQRVGSNLGNEKMISYARMLGLGQPTGINAEDETGGKLPYGNNNARIYSHGDDFEVTPLQLAVMVSAIANDGKVVVPRIPRTQIEKTKFQGMMSRQIKLPEKNLQGVIPGMVGAAEYGTARRGVDASLGIAGKTGSCIGQGSWVGLFASVAPVENPQIAIVVITRGQSERGKYAAAVAGKIYQALSDRLKENGREMIAKKTLILKPQHKVNAETAAELDDAEDEDSDDNDLARKGKKGGADNDFIPKEITKDTEPNTTKSSEMFPPVVIEVKKEQITRPRVVRNN